jgi:catechol 2,3-dioxygenase-like lactoylglutathione lyase family enzyme
VSDADRARGFYVERLGWRLDADFPMNEGYRIVQVTPPGLECSILFKRSPGAHPAAERR